MHDAQLRILIPDVITVLCRRGADFAAAEDAVQEALVAALSSWADGPPRDAKAWLITVSWRKFLDANRAESARHRREERSGAQPPPGPSIDVDDTLQLYFLCTHPTLTPSSAVAVTLRAAGGLTTRQIAQAYLVPETTMAQRISRAKRTVSGVPAREAWRLGHGGRSLRRGCDEGDQRCRTQPAHKARRSLT